MSIRWHMMSEKQLSILIQGRNYARGNRQIIRIPRAFARIPAGAPWLWRSVMQIDKVSQEPARLRMLAPFHGTFFSHWKFIVQCLTHWGRDKMDAILQTTFSNAFSWMKMHEFRLRFLWSLFLSFLVSLLTHICITRPQWVNWVIWNIISSL